MKTTIKSILVLSVSLWMIDKLFRGIYFNGFGAVVMSAILLSVLNTVVKPILKVLALPINILSFGIVSLFINAFMLNLAIGIAPGSYISSMVEAFWASIILTFVHSFVSSVFKD